MISFVYLHKIYVSLYVIWNKNFKRQKSKSDTFKPEELAFVCVHTRTNICLCSWVRFYWQKRSRRHSGISTGLWLTARRDPCNFRASPAWFSDSELQFHPLQNRNINVFFRIAVEISVRELTCSLSALEESTWPCFQCFYLGSLESKETGKLQGAVKY